MATNSLGWIMAMAATLCFSTAPTITRAALADGMDSTALLLGRMVLATILLGVTTAVVRPQAFKISRRVLVAAFGCGLLNALGMTCFFWALTRLEASMASMIISLIPLLVLSLLALRGERLTYRHGVRMALALAGIFLLIGPGGRVDSTGVAVALVSVLFFAVQVAMIQWYLAGADVYSAAFYMTAAMTTGVAIFWVAQGATWQAPTWSGWLAIVGLAVLTTYISRVLMFGAISRIGSGQVAMLTPVETMLTLLWSYLFLDERLTPIQGVGGVLILFSAVLAIKRLGVAKFRPRWRLWARS
jgi:drug/metabolite transporter (DMT)-like permease